MSARREPRRLHHEHHKVPVTATTFYADDLLLTGEGTHLVAYHLESQSQRGSLKIFPSQAIHKILVQPESNKIVVYGGSLIALVSLVRNGDTASGITFEILGSCNDVGDWIFDAAFSPSPEQEGTICVALITAHNALIRCDFKSSESDPGSDVSISVKTVVAGSNCILYCAHISWLDNSLCLIASGTAFGDIILWSSPFDSNNALAKTHDIFPAHEGSVFGVQISPLLEESTLRGPSRVLASCSDDRTVRLWDISDLDCQCPSMTEIQRETGFGSTDENNAYAPPLLAKAMGHISRIWTVRFVFEEKIVDDFYPGAKSLSIASFGEDATRITWDIVKSTSATGISQYSLHQSRVHPLHTGKNIWSSTVSDTRCATGGADGSIALLPAVDKSPGVSEISNELLQLASEQAPNVSKDVYKSFALVSNDTIIATTAQGRIVAVTTNQNGTSTPEPFGGYDSLKSFSMVARASAVAFVAGIGGLVHIWPQWTRRCASVAEVHGKVAGMFLSEPIISNGGVEHKIPSVLLTTVGASTAHLTDIRAVVENSGLESYETAHRTLKLTPGFIVTSFLLVRIDHRDFAILGSRSGSLAAYHMPTNADIPIEPTSIMAHCHGKDAVTALEWKAYPTGVENSICLFSTGRDGTYAVHKVSYQDSLVSFGLVHQVELPFGPNIEGLDFTPDDHLQVWGFKSKNFVVHDATTQQDVATIQCGGVHRNWTYEPSSSGGAFAWNQASTLMWTVQTRLPHSSIHAGGHGREIKAVAVSTGTRQLIATGAEDTDIKIFSHSAQRGLSCLQTLRKHNTGIQHMQWSEDGHYLFSSAGFEEFNVWKITNHVPVVDIGVVCESSHPRSGGSDLRIMGFNASQRVVDGRGDAFDVTMAYSDSSIKQWFYSSGTWTLQASGDYLTACLSQVLLFSSQSGISTSKQILTTATDGHVASWRLDGSEKLGWQQRHKIHQNAILDESVHYLSDGSALLVTAGDDNGIGLSRVSADGEIATLLIPRAHAAAVTALAVHKASNDHFCVASASIDQRVKLWEVRVDVARQGTESIEVYKVQNVYTSVADVSSVAVLQLNDGATGFLVCGVGMDVWRLSTSP